MLTQAVNDTWDDANPGRPKTMGYGGSEEFIRLQFEGYLLSLLSSVKYHRYITTVNPRTGRAPAPPPLPQYGHGHAAGSGGSGSGSGSGGGGGNDKDSTSGDPSLDFGADFVDAWSRTENYRLWQAHTDSHLFEFVEPRHPCAGGLSIDDVQRRIAQQVQDLHLDERLAQGREVLGRNLAAGREKASTLFNKFYADVEALRESQRRKAEEARQQQQQQQQQQQNASSDADGGDTRHHHHHLHNALSHGHRGTSSSSSSIVSGTTGSSIPAGPDTAKTQQQQQQAAPSVSTRASAYVSSWASWAGEKRKAGWGRQGGSSNPNRNTMSSALSDMSSSSLERGGGRGGGGGGGGLRTSMSSFRTTGTGTGTANASPTTATAADADFPPDVIIRNLDEELPPPTPPPRPIPQKQAPPSSQRQREETPPPKASTDTGAARQDGREEATAEASTTLPA